LSLMFYWLVRVRVMKRLPRARRDGGLDYPPAERSAWAPRRSDDLRRWGAAHFLWAPLANGPIRFARAGRRSAGRKTSVFCGSSLPARIASRCAGVRRRSPVVLRS